MQSFILIPLKLLPFVFGRLKHPLFLVRPAMAVCLGLLASSMALAQTTSLRQSQIYQGDIAELTIEYESAIPSLYAIDTSILDSDFIVLDSRSSVSRATEGNLALHRMHWAVQLVPRRSGNLRIPALKFGENHSEPMLLEVKPASALQQAQQSVFVEVEAIPDNPYPGQQTRIVTRVYHNLELYDSALVEPETSPVLVMRSGRDLRYETIRSNTSYKVLERSILLTANAQERLSIEPAIYRGSIRPGNAAEGAATTRYVYRHSNSQSLKLRALPPGFDSSNWLPAKRLEVQLDWDEMDTIPKPGDSLGVTLNLRVTGLPGEALPADLLLRESEQYRIYADQETRNTQIEGEPGEEQFSGSLQQRYVIIFDQPGEITLPGLSLHWWNLDLDRAAVASVVSTDLTIRANKPSSASSSVTGDGSSDVVKGAGSLARDLIPFGLQHGSWWLLLVGGLLMVALLALAKPAYARIRVSLRLINKRRRCLQDLKQACHRNNAAQSRYELIRWGRVHWCDHRINGLNQLARRGQSAHWVRELERLDAAVFALQAEDWHGQTLWELIRQECKSSSNNLQPQTRLLPGLYPQRPVSLLNRSV